MNQPIDDAELHANGECGDDCQVCECDRQLLAVAEEFLDEIEDR